MDADHVVTIIHNNLESDITVDGYEVPMSYQRNVTYFATRSQIQAIKSSSTHCEQYMEATCTGAWGFHQRQAFWTAFTGELIGYDYPDNGTGNCMCRLKEACTTGGRRE